MKKKLKKQIQYTGKRRLMSEYKQIQKKGLASGISASPFHGRLNIWQACIFGPDETLWEGGTFFLRYVDFFICCIESLSLKYNSLERIAKTASTSTTHIYAESSSHRSIRTSLPSSSFRPRCFIRIYTKMEKYV